MNCCNEFGQCDRNANCPARGCSQAKGRDNVVNWVNSVNTPPNYIPKYDEPPMGKFEDFCEFVALTWRPVLFGFFCAIALVAWLVLRS